MSLPTFDEMLKMSDNEINDLLHSEANKTIQSASLEQQPRLRAVFNGCILRSQAAKNPYERMIAAYDSMHVKFSELNDVLQDNKELFDGFSRSD